MQRGETTTNNNKQQQTTTFWPSIIRHVQNGPPREGETRATTKRGRRILWGAARVPSVAKTRIKIFTTQTTNSLSIFFYDLSRFLIYVEQRWWWKVCS